MSSVNRVGFPHMSLIIKTRNFKNKQHQPTFQSVKILKNKVIKEVDSHHTYNWRLSTLYVYMGWFLIKKVSIDCIIVFQNIKEKSTLHIYQRTAALNRIIENENRFPDKNLKTARWYPSKYYKQTNKILEKWMVWLGESDGRPANRHCNYWKMNKTFKFKRFHSFARWALELLQILLFTWIECGQVLNRWE